MLPLVYQERYILFRQGLRQLGELVAAEAIASTDNTGGEFQAPVAELQSFFQTELITLAEDDLMPAVEQRLQSFQVEIDKQLRLLGMDVLFLKSARQVTTIAQRRSQMSDRVQMLIHYCDALVGSEVQGDGEE